MGNRIAVSRVSRRTRIMAVAAAGAVLLGGIGVTSLAAWTDQEYVQGGVGGTGGVGSSTFDVLQSVAADSSAFTSRNASPGGVIDFTSVASTLSPGKVVYGWVQVKTNNPSLDGTLNLKSNITTLTGLSQYLSYGAVIVPSTAACTAAGYTTASGTPANVLAAAASPLNVNGSQSFTLAANGTETKTVCFQLTMQSTGVPTTAMGLTFTPIWYFDAISS
jgi:predicted ribosomally synthesized peptide with SipW-like signal peptide